MIYKATMVHTYLFYPYLKFKSNMKETNFRANPVKYHNNNF